MTSTPASTFPRDASLGFVRTDGVKIADDWADLTDGSLDAKLNVTETGAVSTNTATWLGTLADGTYLRGPWTNCDDFTQNTTSTAVRGIPTNTNGTLGPTSDASLPGIPCTGAAAIYCFEP
jgi:hypothetical protein